MKRDPCPGWLLTSILPPWLQAISWAMANPGPATGGQGQRSARAEAGQVCQGTQHSCHGFICFGFRRQFDSAGREQCSRWERKNR